MVPMLIRWRRRLDLHHRVNPFDFDFPELVVGLQTGTALGNEFEHPAPFLGARLGRTMPCALLISLLFMKTTHGQGDHVLGQNIQRSSQWLTGFDATCFMASLVAANQNLHGMSWNKECDWCDRVDAHCALHVEAAAPRLLVRQFGSPGRPVKNRLLSPNPRCNHHPDLPRRKSQLDFQSIAFSRSVMQTHPTLPLRAPTKGPEPPLAWDRIGNTRSSSASIASTTCSTMRCPRCSAQGKTSHCFGIRVWTSGSWEEVAQIKRPSSSPPEVPAWLHEDFPGGDSPHVCKLGRHCLRRARHNSVWTPRWWRAIMPLVDHHRLQSLKGMMGIIGK